MSERKHSDVLASVGMPVSDGLQLREKDRVIRSQEKRIEQLENEVILLRRDRDRLKIKVSLLSAQKIHGPTSVETHRRSYANRPPAVSAVNGAINQIVPSSLRTNDVEQHTKNARCSCNRLNASCVQYTTTSDQNDRLAIPSFTNLDFSHGRRNAGPTRNHENVTRARNAAIVIQDAYRKYHMKKSFDRLRSTIERTKRSNDAKRTSSATNRSGSNATTSFCERSKNGERSDDEEFSRLTTIKERFVVGREEAVELEHDGEKASYVTFRESSDGSDGDSVVDEPPLAFDASSAAFENVLEEDEQNDDDDDDDSFNSDDDGCEGFATSWRSTIRSRGDGRFATTCVLADDDGSLTKAGNVTSDSVCGDSESAATPDASVSSGDAGSIRPFCCDGGGAPSNFCQLHGHLGAFVRLRLPGASPIWKRKTGQMGSTGSLPESGSRRTSQVSRSSEPSELGTSISDLSNGSIVDHSSPLSAVISGVAEPGGYHRRGGGGDDTVAQPFQQSSRFHCVDVHEPRSTKPPGSAFPCPSTFCTTGAYQELDKLRKRTYRVGLNLFNKKPEQGVQYLIENRFIDFRPNAVARFLVSRKGISKLMIGEYLGNIRKQFNLDVLRCFSEEIDLNGLELDVALRKYQSYFRMPGEAQKIERLIEVFSHRYRTCNSEKLISFRTPDTVFLLAFAVIMLNTDQHNKSIKEEKRMTKSDFIKNLRGIDNGSDLNEDLLSGIYERIRLCEFKTGADHVTQVAKIDQMIVGNKPQLVEPHRRLVCYCRLHEVVDLGRQEKFGSHQREIFLFNDLIVVTKMLNKKKKDVSYNFRQYVSLVGMAVYLFETPYYKFGVRLVLAKGAKVLITLCAQNEHDRMKFIEDLREAIYEIEEMEVLKTLNSHKNVNGQGHGQGQHVKEVNRQSKDSGVVVDVDQIAQQMSTFRCEERKNSISGSIFEQSILITGQLRGSHGSIDSGMASTGFGITTKDYADDGKLTYNRSIMMPYRPTSASASAAAAAAAAVGSPLLRQF